jgi:hypothetical protein
MRRKRYSSVKLTYNANKAPSKNFEGAFLIIKDMAERVGVEPTHGLRRLTDFESAPLDHLGTFPFSVTRTKNIVP